MGKLFREVSKLCEPELQELVLEKVLAIFCKESDKCVPKRAAKAIKLRKGGGETYIQSALSHKQHLFLIYYLERNELGVRFQ